MKILLTDHVKLVRQSLRSLLEREPESPLVREAENHGDMLREAASLRPDVVLLSTDVPPTSQVAEATRQLLAAAPGARVIILSASADRHLAGRLMDAGASGFVLKKHDFEELRRAIANVMDEGTYVSLEFAETGSDDGEEGPRTLPQTTLSALSSRERDVLRNLAEGYTSKEIAKNLRLSLKTVETHRLHITNKLGIRSVAELTKYAIKQGLTSLEH